jgi:frataxin-like iron-binding protein CyaY
MLKEKDLRGFKKKEAKRLRKSETLRAGFSIRAPSHNIWEASSSFGLPSFRLAWEQWTARRDPGSFQDCAILNRHAMVTAHKLLR